MLTEILNKLMQHKNLGEEACIKAIDFIAKTECPEQAGAFLALLHSKPETPEELYGFVKAIRAQMIPVKSEKPCLDIAGTGGDGSNSVNISTAAALVTGSLGVSTTKHGNRSVSSRCGSADFIESLGINIDLNAKQAEKCLRDNNFVFLYAPNFHPNLKRFKTLRTSLGVRTTFNLTGPLTNPASPEYTLIGVYSKHLLPIYADILLKSKIDHGFVVHSCGLDEISLLGPTTIIEMKNNQLTEFELDPKKYGFNYGQLSDIQGDDAPTNKKLLLEALSGDKGPILNTIILNAASALYISDFCSSISEGVEIASDQIQSGKTIAYIQRLTNNEGNINA